MTPETLLATRLKLYCGEHNYIIIRQQSGNFYTSQGIPVKIGFNGLSDYLIITDKGEPVFVETKVRPNKPTKDQLRFIDEMHKRGVKAGVVYSIEDFIELIGETLRGI